MTDEVILEVDNVHRYYPAGRGILGQPTGRIRAVDGVSLDVVAGTTHAVVGESGCGKSTLGRLIVAVEDPSAGQIRYRGRAFAEMSADERQHVRRNIQIVMQDPYSSLNPRMTVGQIVREPFDVHPDVLPRGKRDARVRELLELVGLDPQFVDRYPHQFSGGQRQRVGIARGLALGPEILVCDEAVSALDVSVQSQVLNLLDDLQRQLGVAYVFIAHDLAVVRQISYEVSVMYLGKVVEHAASEELFLNPQHPYTQALLSAVPRPDPTVSVSDRQILVGDLPSPANPPEGCRFNTRCPFVHDICRSQEPVLVNLIDDHRVACHLITGDGGDDDAG